MLIRRLHLHDFRCFSEVAFQPQPGFNLITGENGSGKTTLLEALHLLAHGRSFRGRVRDGLIRSGQADLQVFTEWTLPDGGLRRIGLRHAGSRWEARMDGATVTQLSTLCQAVAVVSFEPCSHALVDGSSEVRRRYLDWGMFHVEHAFMPLWRRYARALKQRNALLRSGGAATQLDAWEVELSNSGEALTHLRETHVTQLANALGPLVQRLLPAANGLALDLAPGWRRKELALRDALLLGRDRDQGLGYTSVGPHRADLRIQLSGLPGRECLSRGQAKQLALALLLAQAGQIAQERGTWPLLQLDDLGSELDSRHQACLAEVLQETGAQILVTGTSPPPGLLGGQGNFAMFHVEHGALRQQA